MRLSTDQVKKVAKLANLPITADEEEKYSEQLSKILDYVDQLNSVNTKNVEPTYNITPLDSVMRKDKQSLPSDEGEVSPSFSQEEALQNSSNTKNGFFVTKGVFEDT